jgi:hypothetical protein
MFTAIVVGAVSSAKVAARQYNPQNPKIPTAAASFRPSFP